MTAITANCILKASHDVSSRLADGTQALVASVNNIHQEVSLFVRLYIDCRLAAMHFDDVQQTNCTIETEKSHVNFSFNHASF
jgi:hypothetical protein